MLLNRPYTYVVYLSGGKHIHLPPRSLGHLRLVARVHFHDAWGAEIMSAFAGRWHPPAHKHGPVRTRHHRHVE
jgi:hypothetical protein